MPPLQTFKGFNKLFGIVGVNMLRFALRTNKFFEVDLALVCSLGLTRVTL